MMCSFLSGPPKQCPVRTTAAVASTLRETQPATTERMSTYSPNGCQRTSVTFSGYLSDISDDEHQVEDDCDLDGDADDECSTATHCLNDEISISPVSKSQFCITQPPPLKRRRLEVPSRVERHRIWEEHRHLLEKALIDIEKHIASKKTKFEAGNEGLQACHARAIQAYLFMVVKNKRKGKDASERAAEAHGFSVQWGGRLVKKWVRKWINSRSLP